MGGAESVTGVFIAMAIAGVLLVAGAIWIRIGIALVDDLLIRLQRPEPTRRHGHGRTAPAASRT
ncbi:MAG: hypothetical protein ACOCVS_02315 [Planctomycetota bacterium]